MHLRSALPALAVFFLAKEAVAAPVVTITAPDADAAVRGAVLVRATIGSPNAIASATATIGTVTAPLASGPGGWSATLDLSSLPLGPATLSVRATDAVGDSTTADRPLKHDQPPTSAVETPAFSVARPSLGLRATCSDSDPYGCATITVRASAPGAPTAIVASATGNTLDESVSLAAYEGKEAALEVIATDTAGLTASTFLRVFVESSPRLVPLEEVAGRVLDFDAGRVLFVAADGNVSLLDRTTRTVSALGTGVDADGRVGPPVLGYLTPTGAIWPPTESRNGVLTNLGIDDTLRARGNYAAWSRCDGTCTIVRRDVVAGTTATVASGGFGFKPTVDVDANGDVAFFWQPPSGTFSRAVYFWAGAGLLPVTIPGWGATVGVRVANGSVIVHQHSTLNQRGNSARWTSTGAEILDPTTPSAIVPGLHRPDADYRQAGDWTAYTKSQGTNLVAWTRSPSGAHALASTRTGTGLRLSGLSSDGEIAVDADGARTLSRAGATLPTAGLAIGGTNGFTKHLAGQWHVVLGRNVFRVETGPLPGGGTDNDAGPGIDAGTSSDGGATGDGGAALDRGAPSPSDASTDGGSAPNDGGIDPDEGPSSSISCAANGSPSTHPIAPLVLVAGLFLARRRQRNRGVVS